MSTLAEKLRLLPDFSMAFTLAVVSKRPATVEVDLAEWLKT
jgi:hypothetical protein